MIHSDLKEDQEVPAELICLTLNQFFIEKQHREYKDFDIVFVERY